MKNSPNLKSGLRQRFPIALTARLAAALLCGAAFALSSQAASGPQITGFKLVSEGQLSLEWTGADRNVVVQLSPSLNPPDWQAIPGVDWPVKGKSWSGIIPRAQRTGFVRLLVFAPGATPMPSRAISLDLIAIHDVGSAHYNANCIACHGDRLNEKAQDGITPAAHSTMKLGAFGTGNQRCLHCHQSGPDFLTGSVGGLRKQVSLSATGCFKCHGKGAALEFYDAKP